MVDWSGSPKLTGWWASVTHWPPAFPSGAAARSCIPWRPWLVNAFCRSPAAMPTRTMPRRCAPIRCSNGRLPETGADLASQPTLSRLENAVDRHACEAMAEALVTLYIRERQRSGAPTQLVLDLDGTDDPVHGNQEGGGYHGFYREHMYHPLLVFDGQTNQLITAVLRPGRCHESRFVVLVLRRLLKRLRAVWPQVTIELRADSGFAVPRLYAWCEANGLTYTIGMIPNRRLVV